MKLTNAEISILKDMIDDFSDRLRHFPDAEMDWSSEEVTAFESLSAKHRAIAMDRGFWWAK